MAYHSANQMISACQVVLRIPALIERPAIGTSCCVTSAEALIAQELWMLPGIVDTRIDALGGVVEIDYDAAVVDLESILTALSEIGYPPVGVSSAL